MDAGPNPLVTVAPRPSVELGPLEVGVMSIAVTAGQVPGRVKLGGSPAVTGGGGSRLRAWRATEVTRKVTTGQTVAAAVAGVAYWGGGLSWTIDVRPGARAEGAAAALPAVGWKSLWVSAP